MRILHAPVNIAGQAGIIAKAQRRLGFQSDALVFVKPHFKYSYDICLGFEKKSMLSKLFSLIANFFRCLFRYDVFHFHFAESLLPFNLDLPILRLFGKVVVMEYWGSDVRIKKTARNFTNFSPKELDQIFQRDVGDRIKRIRMGWIGIWAHHTVIGGYSMIPYAPSSKVVKQAVEIEEFLFVGCRSKNKTIKIVHAPSYRLMKGTKYVIKAVNKLKKEYRLDFRLLENVPNKEVIKQCMGADIIVDQLMLEDHGIFAVECMALGKPVLWHRHESISKKNNDLYFMNTGPENIYNNLKKLITDGKLREQIGIKARKHAEREHDAKIIANQLIELYGVN